MTEDEPRTLNKTRVALPYHLKKMGEEKVLQITRNANFTPTLYNPKDYDADMMILDPGVYYIDYLILNSSTHYSSRWYPGPGIKKSKSKTGNKYLVKIGAFEVKAGQVLYLGQANLPTGGELPFNIINEIDEVKAYLQSKGFNDLANKVEFKPLFQQQSGIIEKNGKVSLINAEVIKRSKLAYSLKLKQVNTKPTQ
ncbi:MAG: hypothetical protein K0M45_10265 [Candidatus Paracaedibacteraceae bacterium]|nr:hypothetical protein [Candidatus Paracaedibacteraceae bacterium]